MSVSVSPSCICSVRVVRFGAPPPSPPPPLFPDCDHKAAHHFGLDEPLHFYPLALDWINHSPVLIAICLVQTVGFSEWLWTR